VNYLSVFSGIEAASAAWGDLGFNPVGFSDIDPFSCAVLSYRFPSVKNYGDINNFKEWKIDKTIRIVAGGSPCQSYSTAGDRKGSKDMRGKLMFTYGSLVEHFKPAWIVWENVPGVLSTNRGQDFREFLYMLENSGYGIAWRVLDAQFFGVPQRRRRVFVVGYFGSVYRAAAVLFDASPMQKHIKTLQQEGAAGAAAPGITGGVGTKSVIALLDQGGSFMQVQYDKTGTLLASEREHPVIVFYGDPGKEKALRHLTPKEEERLQGFPDDWTKVPYKGNPPEKCPDRLRYKAVGNSMAVPVMRWIGKRILHVEQSFEALPLGGGLELTITQEDCMDLMARYPDKYFDLAIVDPPYGIGNDREKYRGGKYPDTAYKMKAYRPPDISMSLGGFQKERAEYGKC
jgi:DNA (cytosine-5)-methyltransferase 1